MRFIHTADWQIGKVFRRFGDKEPVLSRRGSTVIGSIAALAVDEGRVGHPDRGRPLRA